MRLRKNGHLRRRVEEAEHGGTVATSEAQYLRTSSRNELPVMAMQIGCSERALGSGLLVRRGSPVAVRLTMPVSGQSSWPILAALLHRERPPPF